MSADQGWFDAFRDNGGPLLYSNVNRTAAVDDVRNIIIYITFATLFFAFLIIFPGIRKERFSTFICVTISLFVGAVILVANFGTSWHVASATISSPYRAFSKEKIFAHVGVRVGLQSVNITLQATPVHQKHEEINFNERFYWIGPTEMKQEYHNALAKGLPYPILTIAEYLSQNDEGFCWGRKYRLAGYYASVLLWAAFTLWLVMNILLCAVPRYGVFAMQLTGVIMLLANAVYSLLLPRKPLTIPFEGGDLTFTYGWSFWICLIAGVTAVFVGASVTVIDTLFPNKFSTILEVDYDTPYRYFVGNDAHLFGGLAMVNSAHAACQHTRSGGHSASLSTESTCCPTVGKHSVLSCQCKTVLTKRKSDASTSTMMTIPVKGSLSGSAFSQQETINDDVSTDPNHQTTVTTTAQIESRNVRRGIENRGFYGDECDSDGSDVSTTIIDGKKAVSLANFGRYQRQQTIEAQKEGKIANTALWY